MNERWGNTMIDSENTPVEQLWYTWSYDGLESIYPVYQIRAASPGLKEFRSERVKSMERYRPYILPSETDPYAITPEMAPVCLVFLRTEWGEYILVHKQYLGRDRAGRLGNYFTHLLAFGKPSTEFSAQNAIWFWESDIWQTSDASLDRRSTLLDTIPLDHLYDYRRFRPQYAQVQRYLPFLIEAYLIRQPQQQIYIAAPASSTAMIAALITGLTDCLPRQLLAELTFSTYERDIAKATTQIVGTSWIETPGKEASVAQRFSSYFYREKLAVNCSTGEQSSLNGHPLVINNPSLVSLASSFARYAADCLAADDMKVLYELIEQAEKDPELTIERFLRLYSDEVVNRGNLSQEMIESYLANPLYQIEKLGAEHFRANILAAVMSNPQWWQSRLRPFLLHLRERSRQEQMAGPQRIQGQNHQASRQRARKRKASQRAARTSLTLVNALARLAKDAIPSVVSAMEETVTVRDAADETTPRKGMERISTLLDLMSCCLLPEDPIGVWKELLDSLLQKPEACRFLTTNWDIFAWLLRQWDIAFTEYPEYDEAVRRVLVVPWPHLGEFLRLRLQEQHSEWHLFAVDSLIGDTSLTPPIAQLLGQNYGEEITELLKQLMQEQRWWVRVAQFATQLIGNGYPGKPKYYSLIEELLGYLTQVPQYRLLAKDLVVALTLQRYSGTASYWTQIETLLRDLLKEGQSEEGMDLFHTLIGSGYDKERLAPLILRTNLGLVKQVYPTPEEQATFFARNGSQYLSTPEEVRIMSNVYFELLQYPGRPQRLVVFLRTSKKEKFVLKVLSSTPLEGDERVAVLKNYGKGYLEDYQQSPHLAKFVVDSYSWLIQTGYPAKDLLFTLFTSAANPQHLEALLASAPFTIEESAEFFKTYGSVEAYFPFFHQSSAALKLLMSLAQRITMVSAKEQAAQLSAVKMQIVFSWLAPSQLQRSSLKLDHVGEILQAAALTPAEQAQFLERYGQTYLPLHQQLPLIVEYIGNYISTFTSDALDRPEAKKLLAFLWQLALSLPLDDQTQQRLHYWGTINQYLDVPTANPATLKTLAAALSTLGLPNTPTFEGKLAGAFAQCVENKDDLVTIMEYMKLVPKINSLQLLYSLAEECAKLHEQRVEALLPCLLFVLALSDLNTTTESQESFTQVFLDKLLYNVDDPAIWNKLQGLVTQQNLPDAALKRWNDYRTRLRRLGKGTPGRNTGNALGASQVLPTPVRPASSPWWRRFWDYVMADILVNAALKSREVDRIAKTWARYGASVDEFYPNQVNRSGREQIRIATQFIEVCRIADEQPNVAYEQQIVQLASQINQLSLKCTLPQKERIARAQQRMQPPRRSAYLEPKPRKKTPNPE